MAHAFRRCRCSLHAPVRSSRHFADISSLRRNAVLVSAVSSVSAASVRCSVYARIRAWGFGVAAQPVARVDRPPAALAGTLRASRCGGRSATALGGTMTERVQLQCRYHTSHEWIGMTPYQRLMQFASAGALPRRQSGPQRIWPVSLRFDGMRCSSGRCRRCEPAESGVAFARVSVGVFWRLPPNNRVNRTAHQRRCACWWVPSALRAPAAGYAEPLGHGPKP
jgi:hypothetical protein